MTLTTSAPEVLDHDFLPVRAKLLEIAAALDRIDRAGGLHELDPRMERIRQALQVLLRPDDDRAEQIQLLFSRPYEDDWQERWGMTTDE
jgi:hypothetical protein